MNDADKQLIWEALNRALLTRDIPWQELTYSTIGPEKTRSFQGNLDNWMFFLVKIEFEGRNQYKGTACSLGGIVFHLPVEMVATLCKRAEQHAAYTESIKGNGGGGQ